MPATPTLRERILARFDDGELTLLCAEHFPAIRRKFTAGMPLSQRVDLLASYCARRQLGAQLLDLLERERPGLVGADRDALLAGLEAEATLTELLGIAPHKTINATGTVNATTIAGGKVAGVEINLNAPPPLPPRSPRHQLRAPVADFVGRGEEIQAIVAALQPAAGGGVMAISGLRGMGGIGKSELAFAAAQHLAPHFPDAQLVLEMRGASANPLGAEGALQAAIRAFEPLAQLPAEREPLQAMYRSVLNGKRVLIVVDDARDAAQVAPLLPPPGSALLITSRAWLSVAGMTSLPLGALPPAEAERLLVTICARIGEHVPALAALCGYLPLALRVSAGLLATSTRPVARYLQQLVAERLTHLANPRGVEPSVEASLQLSYDALDEAARTALSRLSVFPASFDRAAALAVLDAGDAGDELLDALAGRSLLEWDAAGDRFDLHALVRIFAATRLEDAGTVRLRHARHYAAVADEASDQYNRGGPALIAGLALFDRERAQIDAGWAWALAHAGDEATDALLGDYTNATASIGLLRFDARSERIPRFEAALAAARRRSDYGAEGARLGSLGLAYFDLGDARRAVEFHEQHLRIARKIGDRRSEGHALDNLGLAYTGLGDAHRAVEFHKQCLAIAREIGDRRREGHALGNLGNAYTGLGDTRRAIEFHQQALVVSRELGDRRGEGHDLGNLGSSYDVLGDAHRALEFYEQCLAIARELGDRQGEAITSWNLGLCYEEQGNFSRAAALMQVYVDYIAQLGHPEAEKRAAYVEALRARIAGGEDGGAA
jgi:tetratricopeptide (TPR) repeat protein